MLVAGRTDVGLIREHNEDNLSIIDLEARSTVALDGTRQMAVGGRGALLIVCDGMGGAAAGEVASAMAIEEVSRFLLDRTEAGTGGHSGDDARAALARWMRAAAWDANRKIFDASRADENRAGMGTTMTTVGVVGGDLVMAQVGDSRAYVMREGTITQVTRDQSLVNQLIETGQISEEQARIFEHSNVILQALGVQEDVEVLLSTVALRRGDRVVVCSDGLSGVVTDEEMAAVLSSTDDMDEVCRHLIDMARAAGGPDNITVIAARFVDDTLPRPGAADRVAYQRWRLDEPDEETTVERRAPPERWPPVAVLAPVDPARTFFSLMLLLALSLGGLVTALQIRRSAGTPCTVVGAAGLAIRVDGHDVGLRTQGESSAVPLRLSSGRHRLALRRPSGADQARIVDVGSASECRVAFEEDR